MGSSSIGGSSFHLYPGQQLREAAAPAPASPAAVMDEQAGPGVLFPGSGAVKSPLDGAGEAARALYSFPGALCFLQRQWASFERERDQWDTERSELQSQIAFLQGERRGQENLRKDLQRRIKMLEFSLRQERARFHRLKYGSDLNQDHLRPPNYDSDEEDSESSPQSHGLHQSCAQGQQIINKYLEELGYSDILEVKSNRVRVLLGLSPDQEPQTRQEPLDPLQCVETVMETFRIIERAAAQFGPDQIPMPDPDRDLDRDLDQDMDQDEDPTTADLMVRRHSTVSGSSGSSGSSLSEDPDTEEALRGFDFLGTAEESAPYDLDLSLGRTWDQSVIAELKEQYKRERRGKKGVKRPNRSKLQDMLSNLRESEEPPSGPPRPGRFSDQEPGRPEDEPVFVASPGKSFLLGPVDEAVSLDLGLGELAGLTVANEADGPPYDVSLGSGDSVRRTWSQKFSLRSHLDSVRSVIFHPTEPLLLTASDDHTLKLWNLHKTATNKKCAAVDVEPIYTFRAHSAEVLSVAMSSSGEQFFSGGADGAIYSWNTPSATTDPYDPYEASVLRGALSGHSDAVWSVAYSPAHQRLISCSADETLRVWDAADTKPALTVIRPELGAPSSLDLLSSDPSLMVCSFASGNIGIFSLETHQLLLRLDSEPGPDRGINQVLSHPTMPLTISAEEDRHIRFYDNNTGKLVHSMVAHLDSVTCLSVDPHGLHLMSGSHDCSVRLWSLDSRTCVQEFTAHRRKFSESIHAVAFHRTLGYLCSGGADALAKVYV